MTALNQVAEHLKEKVRKVNPKNPKANSGAVLLRLHKTWEEDIDKFVNISFSIIQFQFSRTSSDSPAGVAKLTATSMLIGQAISTRIQREPLPWNMQVRLGDLFIEAYKVNDLIELYYPKVRDSSYIISATSKWAILGDIPETRERINLVGTSFSRPAPLRKPTQSVSDRTISVVKNSQDEIDLKQPWVRSINKLQQTGWRINRRVLDALLNSEDTFVSYNPIEDNDAKEQKRRSKCIEWYFITEKAKKLKEADAFYQHVEADYRGRLYYSEPFLNFQGSDLARGLLKFARGKPMTDEGLQWLAMHTATSFNMSYSIDEIPEWCLADYKSHLEKEGLDNISVDKMVIEDRIQWTNEYMNEIMEAGKTASFSEDAEKPVAFLAACIEWCDYSIASEQNRIFMTHLPIPIDGSNNGWQHLGAISKDLQTGRLVGLIPTEIQQDFYVQTAKELINLNEDEELTLKLDSMPMKHIRKGISKRGSMTRAYSAGAGKIAENMFFDCKAEDYHITYDITEENCGSLAKTLIKAIDNVCPGPLSTMAYFQNLTAFEIGKYERRGPDGEKAGKEYDTIRTRYRELYIQEDKTDEELDELDELKKQLDSYASVKVYGNGSDTLSWVTPSGFKVQYENWIMRSSKTRGSIDGRQIKHVAQVPSKIPDIRGFMRGVSPNFVHSLDASHMALVIDEWSEDFGAVHDSFSTHACDVDKLLSLTKSVFIKMYDVDNFYNYIKDQLVTNQLDLDVEQPTLGTLNIQGIEESEYFFT